MPEDLDPADGDLALLAFLYASGGLPGEAGDAFERLLARDQAARDALTRAVPIALAEGPPRPDPAYRDRVRARLNPTGWRRLIGPRTYRGHPLLWGALGAAAAALLMLALGRTGPGDPPALGERVVVVAVPVPIGPAPAADSPLTLPSPPADGGEGRVRGAPRAVADLWADLNNHDHLSRALADEQRRRDRIEGRLTRAEERRVRKPGQATDRQ